jgi:hypothetical protein
MTTQEVINGHTVLFDEGDLELYGNSFFISNSGNNHFYLRVSKTKKYFHRVKMKCEDKYLKVDHINGNTLDNRKENLRILSQKDNIRNRHRLHKDNTTGVNGVVPFGKKYIAHIKHNYKKIHLGVFSTISEAKEARTQAELKLWGYKLSI